MSVPALVLSPSLFSRNRRSSLVSLSLSPRPSFCDSASALLVLPAFAAGDERGILVTAALVATLRSGTQRSYPDRKRQKSAMPAEGLRVNGVSCKQVPR
jgi:hypothetical protein